MTTNKTNVFQTHPYAEALAISRAAGKRINALKAAKRNNATPGFAIKIEETTDLGMGILIAEFDIGGYEPVAPVGSIAEAREIAQGDLRQRMRDLESGGEPACPSSYAVWAPGLHGAYRIAAQIEA